MSLQFVITDLGREALVNAANTGTDAVIISEIALGSGYAVATAARTALTTEIKRVDAEGGGTVAEDTIHVTGRDASSDVYSVKEVGLFTSTGILLAIYANNTAFITKGESTVALIAADLVITGLPASSVTVGDSTFAYPPATETVKGVAEIATQAETNADTDDERIVTPKKLAARTATESRRGLIELATFVETIAGNDGERGVTPAALAAVTATTTRRGLIEIATPAEVIAAADTERALTPSHLSTLAAELFKLLYPIGEIYITRRDGSPATWLGFGTWERFGAGRTLVGYQASDSDFDALDKTGGAKTITLSVGEMPGHAHSVGPINVTTSNGGGHSHGLVSAIGGGLYNEGNATGTNTTGPDLNLDGLNATRPAMRTSIDGAHTHSVTVDAFNSGSSGGGGAHSNMQPFITVFMWKRTA